MPNKIDSVFSRTRSRQRVAIMPYLTMGYPEPELSLALLRTLADNGADIIEVGIPHSDPLADGPVIQAASTIALQHNITVDHVMDNISQLKQSHPHTAIVIMTYYNIILQYGLNEFVAECTKNYVAGLVVPDLPPGECTPLETRLRDAGIHMIHMIPPNLSDRRIQEIVLRASGFIYLVSVTGVTGMRDTLPPHVADQVNKLRRLTDTPLALGFGISQQSHVQEAAQWVDGVIIGSALIKTIADPRTAIDQARNFMQHIANYA